MSKAWQPLSMITPPPASSGRLFHRSVMSTVLENSISNATGSPMAPSAMKLARPDEIRDMSKLGREQQIALCGGCRSEHLKAARASICKWLLAEHVRARA